MLNRKTSKIPPFDVLQDGSNPTNLFGKILEQSNVRKRVLIDQALEARHRLEKTFRKSLIDPVSVPDQLDDLISSMWNENWSPKTGNVNLFVTDFGLQLVTSILSVLDGDLIFRSDKDISHLSIWWPKRRLEAFPFHKVLKCLCKRHGESVEQFFRNISGAVK